MVPWPGEDSGCRGSFEGIYQGSSKECLGFGDFEALGAQGSGCWHLGIWGFIPLGAQSFVVRV